MLEPNRQSYMKPCPSSQSYWWIFKGLEPNKGIQGGISASCCSWGDTTKILCQCTPKTTKRQFTWEVQSSYTGIKIMAKLWIHCRHARAKQTKQGHARSPHNIACVKERTFTGKKITASINSVIYGCSRSIRDQILMSLALFLWRIYIFGFSVENKGTSNYFTPQLSQLGPQFNSCA